MFELKLLRQYGHPIEDAAICGRPVAGEVLHMELTASQKSGCILKEILWIIQYVIYYSTLDAGRRICCCTGVGSNQF